MASVAKPYANALFELALESGGLDAAYADALKAIAVFRKEPGLAEFLKNPRVPAEQKESALSKAFPGMEAHLAGALSLMLRKRREEFVAAALLEFTEMAREHKGIVKVDAHSAVALTAEQVSALKSAIGAGMGKEVEIETHVDPSLIGGLMVKAGGTLIDGTIKKHLRTLKKRLA